MNCKSWLGWGAVVLLVLVLVVRIDACNKRPLFCYLPLLDEEAPTVENCPDDIHGTAKIRKRGTKVKWDPKTEVTFADNCELEKTVQSTESGSPDDYFTAEGSPYTISYDAFDEAGNVCLACCEFKIYIRVITCRHPIAPTNGYISCSHGNIFGSLCYIHCMPGYKLDGPNTTTCKRDRTWKTQGVGVATCSPVQCNPELEDITFGTVTCTNTNYYQSSCTYQCSGGYSIARGQLNSRICGPSGLWSGGTPMCKDTSRPKLQCPRPVVAYADEGATGTKVDWDSPEATDNSGRTIKVERTDGPAPGTFLDANYYTVRYVAEDESGNEASCQFSLLVRVINCPAIYGSHNQLVDCPSGLNSGSVCHIQCASGYILRGAAELRCERIGNPPRGRWNIEQPVCEAVQCPDLNPPENGLFRGGMNTCPTQYASWCYLECEEGYQRTGSYSRHCLAYQGQLEGFWDGEETMCKVATCPSPYIPQYASIVNTTACPPIGDVPAGTTCQYECGEGHLLIGQDSITCGNNGRWDGSFPRCETITCDNAAVPEPENGYKNRCPYRNVQYGSTCLLGCDNGYMPVEAAEVTCLANDDGTGRWEGNVFTVCDPVKCIPFDPPANGYIQGCVSEGGSTDVTEPQVFRTVCTAFCDDGFNPRGSTNRNCLVSAIWDGIPLVCEDRTAPTIHCPDPVTVFALPRNDFILADFTWEPLQAQDASPPVDVRLVSINSIPEAANRTTIFPEGTHALLYIARDQEGNEDTCIVDLSVRVTRCLPLTTPRNGDTELITGQGSCYGHAVLGSICRITCEEGYHLQDDSDFVDVECLSRRPGSTNGNWEQQRATCEPNTCNVPSITGGYLSGCFIGQVEYQTTCQFVCNTGYRSPEGLAQIRRTCRADGSWTGSDLVCEAIQCPGGFQLEDGLITPERCTLRAPLDYGTICQFACDDGFRQIGPFSKRCGGEGTWSNPRNVVCVDEQAPWFPENCPRYEQDYAEAETREAKIDYEEPEAIDNSGSVVIQRLSGLEPGSFFEEGAHIVSYAAVDEAGNQARCDIHITILVHRCSPVQAPASGSVDCLSQILGSQCNFQCNVGYEIEGADNTTCILQNIRATWTYTTPRCTPVQCPALPNRPPAIQSGCQSPVYGAVCLWACPYGYQGSGDSVSTCLASGSWSGEDFACDERQCPSLEFPDFIRELPPDCGSAPSFEDSCHLNCKRRGFRIDPPTLDFLRCRGDGQWSQDITNLECIDYESPRFTKCPLDFPVYADRGATQAFVDWEIAAVDNSGDNVRIQCDREAMTYPIGDYLSSCSARDEAGNVASCTFWFRVRTRNCQPLNPPVFGTFVGPCLTIHGSKCTVACTSGYQLEGSDQVTCERDEKTQGMYWERETPPVCRLSTCPPIPKSIIPQGGGIYPTFCTGNNNPNYGVVCRFYCRNGFSPVGYRDPISCQRDGTWDVDFEAIRFDCEDQVEPIVLGCPGNQYATLGQDGDVEVFFDLPSARDNSGQPTTVVTTPPDLSSPHRFAETTVVRYEFFDGANNSASCSFQVIVLNNLVPEVDHCPSDFTVDATGRLTVVEWDTPQFSEPSGDDDALRVTCNFDSGVKLPFGSNKIICTAINSNNGRTAECLFTAEVLPITCPPLRPPRNGAISCDTWLFGLSCSQHCNEKFDVPRGYYTPYFFCGLSGMWSPPIIRDCTARKRPDAFNLATEIQYFSGDCEDPETQRAIQEAFIQLLNSQPIGADICEGSEDCRAENVEITCGPSGSPFRRGDQGTGRFRRSSTLYKDRLRSMEGLSMKGRSDQPLLRRAWDAFDERSEGDDDGPFARREARHTARSREFNERRRSKRTLPFVLTIAFKIVVDVVENETLEEDVAGGLRTLRSIKESLEDNVITGGLDIEVPEVELYTDDVYTDSYPTTNCPVGQEAQESYIDNVYTPNCVSCPKGTYYNETEGICLECWRGEYQDHEGALECKVCPEGHTTLEDGAQGLDDCEPVCPPGSYSYNGVEPCALCEVGYYQPYSNMEWCDQCGLAHQRTLGRGSTSSDDCLFECAPGTHSETSLEPCEPCVIRYYQPEFGQRFCEVCPNITTTLGPGAVYVEHCNVTATCPEEHECLNGATCLPLLDGPVCQCQDGFEGEFCEVNIDECADLNCQNGTCIDGINSASCECQDGFEGDDCSTDILECETDPCDNYVNCVDIPGGFTCECVEGYSGTLCEEEIRACESEPCQNNGICTNILADFSCTCPAGFTGDTCEVNINDCQVDPCLNGGICIDLTDAYECSCTPGYRGSNCETDVDLCDPSPCIHGTCLKEGDNFTCICPNDKAGRFCERDADFCDRGSCKNGVCSIPPPTEDKDFICDCTGTGYSGPQCESRIDHCSTGPCSNGGTCQNNLDDYSCVCQTNFTGVNCEHYIDPCEDSPCENNGTCTPDAVSFTCACPVGFEGDQCEQPWTFCREDFCQNGGSCGGINSVEFCICPIGFQGIACEQNIDDCKSNPCQNGGTCTDGPNSYGCSCVPGYSGQDCEEDINECLGEPCVQGLCTDRINNYTCECYDGYEGLDCSLDVDDCANNLCEDGRCVDGNSTYTCECDFGYRGRYCEEEIDECASSPCVNALECIDGLGSFECRCEDGWTGLQCEQNINDCNSESCENGGTCIDQHLGFECLCIPGYGGKRCQRNINDCESSPCHVNATCVDKLNDYACICPIGREGKNCQVRTSICQPNPCRNGGTCSLSADGDSFSCFCQEGFLGDTCEENVDDCEAHECQNGAKCVDQVRSYSCVCLPGYRGDLCDVSLNPCEASPCENGGTCSVDDGQAQCECPTGYEGALCQSDINDCLPNPCEHNATCIDALNDYTCQCAPGYTGELCENDIDECLGNNCHQLGSRTCEDGVATFTCVCRHGWSGQACDIVAKSNFDMVFTANQTAQYVLLRDFSNETVQDFTLALWVRTVSQDSLIFSHVTDEFDLENAHIILAVPRSLTVVVNGVAINTGARIGDDLWHHVALTFNQAHQLFSVYIDGQVVTTRLLDSSGDIIHPNEVFVLGRLNETVQEAQLTALFGSLTRLNIWDTVYSEAQIQSLASACHIDDPGNVIGMVDFLDGEVGSVIFLDPSVCEVGNDCAGSPCNNGGSCVDSFYDFYCLCPVGYYGKTCSVDPDDCLNQLCENGGTCVDGLDTFYCICGEDFTGNLCELDIVHGDWSEWSDWSECSAECEGGDQGRTRNCTNPAPANGGSQCGSEDTEWRKCNQQPCPACREFVAPNRGYAECETSPPEEMNCKVFCNPGYDFTKPPLDKYSCGPSSEFKWNHESGSNPKLRVPACTKYSKPNRFQIEIFSKFPSLQCLDLTSSEANAVKTSISVAVASSTLKLGCLASGLCKLRGVSATDCAKNIIQSPRSTEGVTVKTTISQAVNVTADNVNSTSEIMEQPEAVEAIENLLDISNQIRQSIQGGDQRISTNGRIYDSEFEYDYGYVTCDAGYIMKYNSTACLPCPAGSCQVGVNCHFCAVGYYQPEEAKTACLPCPDGHTNTGLGSVDEEECEPSTHFVIS